MNVTFRVIICAATGWLAGEVIARTMLHREPVREDAERSKLVSVTGPPAPDGRDAEDEWRAFLAKQNVAAPFKTGDTRLAEAVDALSSYAGGEHNSLVIQGPDTRLDITRGLIATSPEDFPRRLKVVVMIRDPRVRRQVAGAFFAAWAEHDPRAAIQATNIPGISMAALNGVLKVWAERDPRGMIQWLKSPDTFGWAKMQAATNAFVFLVEHDPRLAMDLAVEFNKPGDRADRNTVFLTWFRRDQVEAERWIAGASDTERQALFEPWTRALTNSNPADAWQLVMTQSPDRSRIPQLLPPVFSAWQKQDPAAARAALQNLPPDVWRPAFASLTGSMLAPGEAAQIEAVAASVPTETKAAFWAGVADGSLDGGTGPQAAAEAFAHLPSDYEDRMNLAERITKQWLRNDDEEAASNWVQDLPRDRARDFAAAALAEGIVLTDPEAARRWAADIQDERIRQDVLKRISR